MSTILFLVKTKTSFRNFLWIPSLFIKMAQTLCTKWWHTLWIFFPKKNSLFNELARFGQFIKYTLFKSPLSPHLVPISAAERPHLVPISLKTRSPFGPYFEKFRSPFHVGAVYARLLAKTPQNATLPQKPPIWGALIPPGLNAKAKKTWAPDTWLRTFSQALNLLTHPNFDTLKQHNWKGPAALMLAHLFEQSTYAEDRTE